MLEFLSIDVPAQLQSCWNQIYCTTKRILMNNPIIISYWVLIRRDNFYRRLSRLKLKSTEDIWMKLLKRNDNISLNDIDQIYLFIRTSVHLVITDNYCTSPYYAQIKLNEEDRKTRTITLSGRLLQSDSYSVRIIDYLSLQKLNLYKRKCSRLLFFCLRKHHNLRLYDCFLLSEFSNRYMFLTFNNEIYQFRTVMNSECFDYLI